MNAYELADKLQELDAKLHLIDLFKSADMLRQQADELTEAGGMIGILREQVSQQADEIKLLRQGMKNGFDGLETMTALSKAQAARITELEKINDFLNDGWNKDQDRIAELEKMLEPWGIWFDEAGQIQPHTWETLKPTPQTKPLNQQTLECPSYLHNFAPQTKPLSDEEILSLYWRAGWESDEDVIKFGRAIEAKVRGES